MKHTSELPPEQGVRKLEYLFTPNSHPPLVEGYWQGLTSQHDLLLGSSSAGLRSQRKPSSGSKLQLLEIGHHGVHMRGNGQGKAPTASATRAQISSGEARSIPSMYVWSCWPGWRLEGGTQWCEGIRCSNSLNQGSICRLDLRPSCLPETCKVQRWRQ